MTSENDRGVPSSAGMFSIDEFCRRNQIGRSTTYGEIASGRLNVAKIGRLTRITNDAEIEWRRSLPAVERRANLDRDAANYVRRSVQRGKH
jgi:hypothetical protein